MFSRSSPSWMLLIWFTGSAVSGLTVTGVVGHNTIVPCSYRVARNADITTMCWGRGLCPSSKCSDPIIWTDGRQVTVQTSKRYQLRGNLQQGDVSLTIVNAQESDSGMYCCRVEIPGWFNDQITNYKVVIKKARITTPSPHTHTSEQTSAPWTASDSSLTVTATWPLASPSEDPQTVYDPSLITSFFSNWSDITTDLQHISGYQTVISSKRKTRQPSFPLGKPDAKFLKNVSVSAHSAQYSEKGIYMGIGISVALLAIFILALLLSRHYLHNMKKLNNFPNSVLFWRSEREGNQNGLEVEVHAEENIYTIH